MSFKITDKYIVSKLKIKRILKKNCDKIKKNHKRFAFFC
jgi:hypothetical protein